MGIVIVYGVHDTCTKCNHVSSISDVCKYMHMYKYCIVLLNTTCNHVSCILVTCTYRYL